MKKLIFAFIYLFFYRFLSGHKVIFHTWRKQELPPAYCGGKPFLMLWRRTRQFFHCWCSVHAAHLAANWKRWTSIRHWVPVYWGTYGARRGSVWLFFGWWGWLLVRENNLKLVLLWFGSWKNSMSCYAPGWVKKDFRRFPRTRDRNGVPSEI